MSQLSGPNSLYTSEDYGSNILFIGAHCDDIEIGCGGTAAKLVDLGRRVVFAIATHHNSQRPEQDRQNEARRAAELIGLSEENQTLCFGDFPETELLHHQEGVLRWLQTIIRTFRPDTVFVHHEDLNNDHGTIFRASVRCFNQQRIIQYLIPQLGARDVLPFSATFAEDITGYIHKKLDMCACHESQAADKPVYLHPEIIKSRARAEFTYSNPTLKTLGYAEPFHLHYQYGKFPPNASIFSALNTSLLGDAADATEPADKLPKNYRFYDWDSLDIAASRLGKHIFEEFGANAIITFSGHSAIFANLVMVKTLPREKLLNIPSYLAQQRDWIASQGEAPPSLPGFTSIFGKKFVLLLPEAFALGDPDRKKRIAIIDDAITTGEAISLLKDYLRDSLGYETEHIRVGCFVSHEQSRVRPDFCEFTTPTTAYRLPWGEPIWFPRAGQ
jgi:LmbE family N-acetylglucosaminyl deacetylase